MARTYAAVMRRGLVALAAALGIVFLTASSCPPPAPHCPYPLVAKYDGHKWRCVNSHQEAP